MIPTSMMLTNPVMVKLEKELSERKICRICLVESEKLINILNQQCHMILTNCFAISTVVSEKLPKFVCESCCEFLKKCHQFKQMCKKTELLMSTYPLTGKWPDKIEVPSWLRPVQKRLQNQEIEGSISTKKTKISCDETTNVLHYERNGSPIGTIRIRTSEALNLQSPTISSDMQIQSSVDLESSNPNIQTVIQCNQNTPIQNSYLGVPSYPQYQSSTANIPSDQKPSSCPLLKQQLQQASALPPSINSLQYLTQQVPYIQHHQQPQPLQRFQHIAPQLSTTLPAQPRQHTAPPKQRPATTAYRPIQPAMPPLPASAVQCTTCAFVFANQNHLIQHMRKHLGHAEYHCGCGQQFYQLDVFVHHLKQHTNILWCGLCGEQFETDWKLRAHLDQHPLAGLAQSCDFCPLVFIDHSSRLRHVGRKHSDEVRQLMCMNPSRNGQ